MIKIKVWCTKCDCLLEAKGKALDCPIDGIFIICPSCGYRATIFIEMTPLTSKDIKFK
jgi:hypothetical protein